MAMSGAAQRPTGSAAVPPRALQAKQEANYIRPVEGKSARGLTWRGCWGTGTRGLGELKRRVGSVDWEGYELGRRLGRFGRWGWPSVALRHIDIETFFLGSSLQTTLSIVGVVPKAMSGYWYVRKE
ncbi:unnamed protein product [Durusdinium trenchii]|uniref:Uncharacterized protein n=1 Tax=Durusdinium trenchii TaxID=1381693 RepID=A0ABP0KFK5_9DINO